MDSLLNHDRMINADNNTNKPEHELCVNLWYSPVGRLTLNQFDTIVAEYIYQLNKVSKNENKQPNNASLYIIDSVTPRHEVEEIIEAYRYAFYSRVAEFKTNGGRATDTEILHLVLQNPDYMYGVLQRIVILDTRTPGKFERYIEHLLVAGGKYIINILGPGGTHAGGLYKKDLHDFRWFMDNQITVAELVTKLYLMDFSNNKVHKIRLMSYQSGLTTVNNGGSLQFQIANEMLTYDGFFGGITIVGYMGRYHGASLGGFGTVQLATRVSQGTTTYTKIKRERQSLKIVVPDQVQPVTYIAQQNQSNEQEPRT